MVPEDEAGSHRESVSADATLRAFAPACLREPYLRAIGARGLLQHRTAWTVGFGEQVTRYVLALLAPEAAEQEAGLLATALSLEGAKLSEGSLFELACSCARAVQGRPRAVAAPAADFLLDPRGRRTEAARALLALIQARNQLAHGDTGPVSADSDAQARFDRDLVHHLRAIARGLEFVRTLPIYALDPYDLTLPRPQLLRFAGPEPARVPLTGVPAGVPVAEPLLIAADGRWVGLGPFMSVMGPKGGLVPRLLPAGRRETHFFEPHGESTVEPTATWAQFWNQGRTLRAPRPAGAADALLAAATERRAEGRPDLGPSYAAIAPIERGSSATVWLVEDPYGRKFAAKVLHDPLRASAGHRRRLAREVDLLRRCHHRGLVRAIELLDDCPAAPALVMEYVAGADLGRLFARERATPAQACALVSQVLAAVDHLHGQKAIHRDIKPANVLQTPGGEAVLVDLGVAHDAEAARMTGTVEGLGTRLFAAPEQYQGAAVDARTDVYAVGRLLAWLVGGDAALERGDLRALPTGLEAVVRRATARAPEQRYPDAQTMLAALQTTAASGWCEAPLALGDVIHGLRLTGAPTQLGPALWQAEVVDPEVDEAGTLWFARLGQPDAEALHRRARRWSARKLVRRLEGLLVVHGPAAATLPPEPTAAADGDRPQPERDRAPSSAPGPPPPPAPGPQPPRAPGPQPPRAPGPQPPRTPTPIPSTSPAPNPTPTPAPNPTPSPAPNPTPAPPPPSLVSSATLTPLRLPPWFGALPALESVPTERLDQQLALECGLLACAVLAALTGPMTSARWFRHRLDARFAGRPTWERLEAMFAAALEYQPRGPRLRPTWGWLAQRQTPADRLGGVRRVLSDLVAQGATLEAEMFCEWGGLRFVWDAHDATGLVGLADATMAPLPAAIRGARMREWLTAGLQFGPIHHHAQREPAVVGESERGRPLALAVPVDHVDGNPAGKVSVALHLLWAQRMGVRLIGLTDGDRWRWLRRDGVRGLREVVGDPAAVLSG